MSYLLMIAPFSVAKTYETQPLSRDEISNLLGWNQTNENRCGGYYLEGPFAFPETILKNKILISSDQYLFAQHGTSVGQGRVTITRFGQQIIANKAYIYRDPMTGKLSAIDLVDQVTLREPNTLVIAKYGRYILSTKAQSLHDILFRTAIYSDSRYNPVVLTHDELQKPRKIYQLSGWGEAKDFIQEEPKIFEFDQATYTTCPPLTHIWQVKTSHLTLNKETGRGVAKHARILVKGIPVFYTPYLNFPIDSRRQTGFLAPAIGSNSSSGPYLSTPFYWNMAPNYDMTIKPALLSKRGLLLSDSYRYLTTTSNGNLKIEILPSDKQFADFKTTSQNIYQSDPTPTIQSELRRLRHADTTRKSISWQNDTHFDEHWSSDIDYNWVSDDYYLRDFSSNLNQVTQNQLLQQGQISYKGQNWNLITRVQGYQTLHPVDQNVQFLNQYTRAPQFIFNGYYPDNPGGFEYFIDNDFTRFDIRANPGSDAKLPMGNRIHMQPGISRPFNTSYLTVTPRLQFAMTQYEVGDVTDPNPKDPNRALPIFDLNTGLYFDRNISFLNRGYYQTLEPQIYYTYIPYRRQDHIPVFDTTVNTLTYDQLFSYNRFSGLDRINDANQVSVGMTTRFIDQQTGLEKIKAGLGQIFYFKARKVTLCSNANDAACADPTDVPTNPDNTRNKSPLSGLLSYKVDANWSVTSNTIWNPQTTDVDNESIALHYQIPDSLKIVNIGYNFVRNGDPLPGDSLNTKASNLSQTDFSFSWPLRHDWSAVARWTQNWNHNHFQNVLYGLQYDSCCWAIRFVTGRVFTNLSPSNSFQYNTQFYIQFALKGLGNIGNADPSQLLNSGITGYQTNFGRDF